MESTGETTKIHLSPATAALVQSSPFAADYNVVPRPSPTFVKGKGTMQTFFLEPGPGRDLEAQYAQQLAHVDVLCAAADERRIGGGNASDHPSAHSSSTRRHSAGAASPDASVSSSSASGVAPNYNSGLSIGINNNASTTSRFGVFDISRTGPAACVLQACSAVDKSDASSDGRRQAALLEFVVAGLADAGGRQ